jgi:uncharacterized protein YukE
MRRRQAFANKRHYDAAVEHPELYVDQVRPPLDEAALAEIGRKHLAHIHLPHLPIPGMSAAEKKLVFWICDHTGAPNPFHALERLTGDGIELQRVEKEWTVVCEQVTDAVAEIRDTSERLRAGWSGAEAARFGAAVDSYLAELDALTVSIGTTRDCLKAIRSEAQLAEGTIQMLINLLVGSLGGLLVAEFVTAGTVTPVAAAQAQMELAYVGKKIAFIGSKLHMLYADVTKILAAVHGFKRMDAAHFVFEMAPGGSAL